MKKLVFTLVLFSLAGLLGLSAQSVSAGAANGMTFNGSTGLIVVPDARIGWENADIGLDVGYGFIWGGAQDVDHLPRFALSLARKVEIHGLIHLRDEPAGDNLQNFIVGGKFQLFKDGGSALALGLDAEMANQPAGLQVSDKVYLAATYAGRFFDVPAVTTATIGWQFLEYGEFSSQFIYGMGFSMSLFPSAFKNYVYWITDFSNFSFAVDQSAIGLGRGAFNTGIRIRPIKEGRFNLIIDVLGTDLLDDGGRALGVSFSGGMAF